MRPSLKWALGIIGAVVVGALGSGLWSTIFAPVGSWLIKLALSIVTLGLEAAKDSMYRRASFGFRERSGDILVSALATAVLLSPIFIYLIFYFPRSRRFSTPAAKMWRRRVSHFLLICFVLASSNLFVQLLMSLYSNAVVANFHRTLAVAAPHISSEERTIYLARFAKVQTRKDFMILFVELNSVLEKNGEARSDFSPW